MITPSQNHFNLENMKKMTKMSLPSLELTILIINFLSTNLKTALKKLPIGNFKKHLMIKNTPYYRTTKEIKKFVKNFETKIIPKSPKQDYFYVVTVFTIKLHALSLFHHFHLN